MDSLARHLLPLSGGRAEVDQAVSVAERLLGAVISYGIGENVKATVARGFFSPGSELILRSVTQR
jgi:hypothetical protein